jgi:hypothetical protein
MIFRNSTQPGTPGNNKKLRGDTMISVYNEDREVVAEVQYNDNLDYWDGNNHTCGSTGHHKGLTQLEDGRFVLIHGTQWQGERDTAEIITPEQAVQEILHSGNTGLFDEFPELEEVRKKNIAREKGKVII